MYSWCIHGPVDTPWIHPEYMHLYPWCVCPAHLGTTMADSGQTPDQPHDQPHTDPLAFGQTPDRHSADPILTSRATPDRPKTDP